MKNRANYMQNSMKRGAAVAFSLMLCLSAAACESRPPASAPTGPSISVSYVDGNPPGVAVAAIHPQPLLSAELVGPDGGVVSTASAVERDTPARSGSFGLPVDLGVGIFGGSGGGIGTGIGVGVPLGGSPPPADPNRYRARVPVSDTAAYRRDWERSSLRLKFGTATDNITAEIPAPAPKP